MKKVLLCAAAVVLQAAFFPSLAVRGASFNATLFILVWFCFSGVGAAELFAYALFSGIALDALSGAPFGALALAYAATAVLLRVCARVFPRENMAHFAVYISCATAFFFFAAEGMWYVIGSFPAHIVFADMFAAVAYNAVGGVFFYWVMKKWIIS